MGYINKLNEYEEKQYHNVVTDTDGNIIDEYDSWEVPDRPSDRHIWNGAKWILDKEKFLKEQLRPERNKRLDEIDIKSCNAEKWEDYTQEQKKALKQYKKALKELPQNLPYELTSTDEVVWPVKPDIN